jgi:outer membrane protein assembly factor BamA
MAWLRLALLVCICGGVSMKAQNVPAPPPAERVPSNVIEGIEFRGLRRLPSDPARALLTSKAGSTYDEPTVRSDLKKLWDTGRFDDVQVQKLDGVRGKVIVRFTVTERVVRR